MSTFTKSDVNLSIAQNTAVDSYSWMPSLLFGVSDDYLKVTSDNGYYKLDIKLLVMENSDIESVELFRIQYGDECRLPLVKMVEGSNHVWKISLSNLNQEMLKPFSFRFRINTGKQCFFLDEGGVYKYNVTNRSNFQYFHRFSTPSWLDAAVIYHIFVDSFAKGKSFNSEEHLCDTSPDNLYDFKGGDIFGIIQKLDYLKELGINAICLTPIFKSLTNHRYDIEDYFQVDEKIGGNCALIELTNACKEREIKLILDGVFNHVSGRSKWFDRERSHKNIGAYGNSNSIYCDFFIFYESYRDYSTFWGDEYLPKLNYKSHQLRKIIYSDEKSVIKHWMGKPYLIDGWRLDASCMIGKYDQCDLNAEILTELYAEAKDFNRDCYIFGEHPFDPSEVAQYLHMDGITNYSGFYTPLVYWLDESIDFDAKDLDLALREFRSIVGFQFSCTSKNFIGNHDKTRLYSLLRGDIDKYYSALTLLFTYPGIPSIYYGEEIGLSNETIVNDSRIAMQWLELDEQNERILTYSKFLVSLYKSSDVLQRGIFKPLYSDSNIYIYERSYQNNLIIVILNNSSSIVKCQLVTCHSLQLLNILEMKSLCSSGIKISRPDKITLFIENISDRAPIILMSSHL